MEEGIQHDQAPQCIGISTASPRSNIDSHYPISAGCTNIESGTNNGGRSIALSPDWAITGSANLLDELHYIAELNKTYLDGLLSDKDLVEMVTVIPAIIAGIAENVGTIKEGLFADLLIIQWDKSNPYNALIEADSGDVQLVLINGIPIYGSLENMELFWNSSKYTVIEILGKSKAVLEPKFSSVYETLEKALFSEGIQLAPIVEEK